MIKPTIGRVVLVYRGQDHVGNQWSPADICHVNEDGTINVSGVDQIGFHYRHVGLELLQGDIATDPVYLPEGLDGKPFACWMPYQRQAAERNR